MHETHFYFTFSIQVKIVFSYEVVIFKSPVIFIFYSAAFDTKSLFSLVFLSMIFLNISKTNSVFMTYMFSLMSLFLSAYYHAIEISW